MKQPKPTNKKLAQQPVAVRQRPTELNRIEAALRESEEECKTVFDDVDAVIVRMNKYGRITEINSKVEEFFGFKREEVIGKHFTKLGVITLKDLPRLISVFKDSISGKVTTHRDELETRDKNGNRIFIEVKSTAVKRDGKIEGTIAIINNITERRKTEEALRESEEKFSSIFYDSPMSLSLTRLKDDAIIEINDSYTTFSGYTREDIIGRKVDELNIWVKPGDRQRMFNLLKVKGNILNEEFNFRVKSGEINTVLLSADKINLQGDDYLLVMSVDISERKHTEEALRESEEKFSTAFNTASDAICILSSITNLFLAVNDSYAKLSGYSRDELIGHNPDELGMWAKPEDRVRSITLLKENGRLDQEEFALRTKTGDIRTCLFSAEPTNIGGTPHMIVVVQDITERKKAEQSLRESEEKFRNLFEHARDAVILANADTGILVDINPAGCDMLGRPKDQIIGQHMTLIHPPEMAEQFKKVFQAHVEKGIVTSEDSIIQRADGTRIAASVSASVVKLGDRNIIQGVFRDISRRKQVEERLRFSDSAFKSLQEGIIAVDSQNIVTYWNDISEQVFGVPAPEAIGKNLFDIIRLAPKRPEEIVELHRKLMDQGYNRGEMHYRTPRGEVWVDMTIQAIEQDAKRYGYVITALDIAERKRAEEALRESEEKFSKAFSSSANAICILSLPDNKFVEINDSYTRFTGYSREEVIGRTVAELQIWANPEDLERLQNAVEKDGKFTNFEFHARMKSGEIRVGLSSAEVINIGGKPHRIVVITDISERKKAEEALKRSEENFRHSLDNSPLGIRIIDAAGKSLYFNQAILGIYGYRNIEEFNTVPIEKRFTPEGYQAYLNLLQKRARSEPIPEHHETSIVHKDGKIRYLDVLRKEVLWNGEKQSLLLYQDITERKQAEEALKERERRFSDIAENALEWIWETDANGKYTYSSPIVEKILGYKSEEMLGKHFYDLFSPENREEMKRAAFEVFVHKQPFREFVNQNVRKNGETVWLSTSGTPIIDEKGNLLGYRGVDTDITERKRSEEALQESEEKFSKAFSAGANAICITSLKDNRLLEINESFTRFTGYSHEEVIGRSASDLKLWVKPEELKRWMDAIEKDGRAYNQEFSSRSKSGEIRIGLGSAEVINIAGEPCRIVAITDITERKQAEEKLQHTLADLEQSSIRLEAANKELEAFSYSVSHDLRSPLRSIDGFSQALLEDYTDKLDDNGRDYLGRLRGASQKMGELIDGLLKLSRLSRSEMHLENVDLSALADEIANRLQETQPERKVEFNTSRGLTAQGDPQLLRALLENLIGNAWKFTGKVAKAKIEFGAIRNGTQKTFFVRDNGAGFDMSYVDKLFGAFQRLHDVTEFPGTGIGLATVRRIINRHGGTVRAEGEVGKGAAFYFTLD